MRKQPVPKVALNLNIPFPIWEHITRQTKGIKKSKTKYILESIEHRMASPEPIHKSTSIEEQYNIVAPMFS
jgi:hypothetical protein